MIQFKAKTTNGEIINSALNEFLFPAGEVHIKREDRRDLESTELAIIYADQDIHRDLFMLQAWDNLIEHEAKGTYRVAVIPYFPGARADHNFPMTIDLYVNAIAVTQVDEIIIFDPHSEVLVDKLKKLPELKVTVYHPTDALKLSYNRAVMPHVYSGVIAPDKGAVKRAQKVADLMDVKLYRAEKVRNQETGELTNFTVETLPTHGRLLILDDICDGGGTFAGLMEAAGKRIGATDLYVSHGVFSGKAIELLSKTFDKIFTTNSYNPQRELVAKQYGGVVNPYTANKFHRLNIITMMLEGINPAKTLIIEPETSKTGYIPLGDGLFRVTTPNRSALDGRYKKVYHTPLGQRMPKETEEEKAARTQGSL
jgi:ribose-phosphate pyrophosphokinase